MKIEMGEIPMKARIYKIMQRGIILAALGLILLLAACGEKITAKSLLEGAAAAPGLRANLAVELVTASGSREQTVRYEGALSAKDNVRYMKGDYQQGDQDREMEYYFRFTPGRTPEENQLDLYAWHKKDGLWNYSSYLDTMISLRDMFQSVKNPVLPKAEKNAASYTVTGTISFDTFRSFAMISHCGTGISTVILQLPEDTELETEITFSGMNRMPVAMSCRLPASAEAAGKTVKSFTVQMTITDMTLSALEIPEEALEDAGR